MEIKKSPKADLQNKRALLLEIGLVLSLAFILFAFNWSQREKGVELLNLDVALVEEEIIEITRQDEKPPEPVKQTIAVVSDIINVVKDDSKIQTEFDFADFGEDDIVIQAAVVEEVAEEDAPFMVVEDMPKFQGGDLNTFRNWVLGKLRYPVIAQENGIQGKVILTFVIEKDGTLTNIEALMSPDASLTEEAVRVLKSSPKWTAGKQRGVAVRVKYTLPVDFKLQQ